MLRKYLNPRVFLAAIKNEMCINECDIIMGDVMNVGIEYIMAIIEMWMRVMGKYGSDLEVGEKMNKSHDSIEIEFNNNEQLPR